jgi:GH24 family phage-related lysozyme (muramidase)
MKKVSGNHLGIVVNTADPENRGRVQVFVPHISTTLYSGWNENLKDIKFKTFTSDVFTDEIKQRLWSLLPWAEAAVPCWGGGTGAPIDESTGLPMPIPTDQAFASQGPSGTIRYKSGISGDGLQGFVKERTAAFFGQFPNATITSTTGGRHSAGSLHYSGRAIDIRTYDQNPETIRQMVNWWGTVGGATEIGYEVNSSSPHLHIGFRTDGRRTAFNVGSTPSWWSGFASSFRNGSLPQSPTNPGTSQAIATATVDPRKVPAKDGLNNKKGEREGSQTGPSQVSGTGLTQNFINAVKDWEAGKDRRYFRTTANPDRGLTTVGFGTEAPRGTVVDEKTAERLLIADLSKRAVLVNNALNDKKISLTQSQKEALISYTFNRGPNGLKELLDESGPTWDSISNNMLRLFAGERIRDNPNDPFRAGLISRRQWEIDYANSDGSGGGAVESDGSNIFRTTNAGQNAYPPINSPRAGGPMGFYSTPAVGAKVWVFFEAENPQRPVFFANAYEPSNII